MLAGPKSVTIYDPRIVSIEDAGKNFYIREEHVGKVSRAQASLEQLKELNSNCQVTVATSDAIEGMYIIFYSELVITNVWSYLIITIETILSPWEKPFTRKTSASSMLAILDFMVLLLLILERNTELSMVLVKRANQFILQELPKKRED